MENHVGSGQNVSLKTLQQKKELINGNGKFSRAETNLFWFGVFSEDSLTFSFSTLFS